MNCKYQYIMRQNDNEYVCCELGKPGYPLSCQYAQIIGICKRHMSARFV